MTEHTLPRNIRLPRDIWAKIDDYAEKIGENRSTIIRIAIAQYLSRKSASTFDHRRIAALCEFTQLIAEEWLRQNAPDKRDTLLERVDQRLEKHHGA
jgi:Arc/MetJ-type ribon-helix-helix transcriptional regulator